MKYQPTVIYNSIVLCNQMLLAMHKLHNLSYTKILETSLNNYIFKLINKK